VTRTSTNPTAIFLLLLFLLCNTQQIVVNYHHGVSHEDPRHGSASAYVTFAYKVSYITTCARRPITNERLSVSVNVTDEVVSICALLVAVVAAMSKHF
jgi:hypothetical protein